MNFDYLPKCKEIPAEPRYELRARNHFLKFCLLVAFSIFFAAMIYRDPASHVSIEPLLVAVGISVIAYYWYIYPFLELTPTGMRVVNIFSTRMIHWEVFRHIDIRFGLVITSEADASKKNVKTRKIKKHNDFVGAFGSRAKDVEKEKNAKWEKTGEYKMTVTTGELPHLIYSMNELHRKIMNPKDVYQGPTNRSTVDRVVRWNITNIAIFLLSVASIISGIWMLLH